MLLIMDLIIYNKVIRVLVHNNVHVQLCKE